MVPVSFKTKLSYSRGMKKSIYTLRPGAMSPRGDATVAGLLNNWVHGVDHPTVTLVARTAHTRRHVGPTSPLCRLGFKAVLKGFKVI